MLYKVISKDRHHDNDNSLKIYYLSYDQMGSSATDCNG